MGLKKWKRFESVAVFWLLLLFVLPDDVTSYNEVGCLFSNDLCKVKNEFCYNDLAFGKCLEQRNDLTADDLYQYDLSLEELELLRLQLEQLEDEGFKWSDYYTQCVMQSLLFNLRYGITKGIEGICTHPSKKINYEDTSNSNKAVNSDDESDTEPESIGKINYESKKDNYDGDEFFYSISNQDQPDWKKLNQINEYDDNNNNNNFDYLGNPDEVYRRGSRSLNERTSLPQDPSYQKENYPDLHKYYDNIEDLISNSNNGPLKTDEAYYLANSRPATYNTDNEDDDDEDYQKDYNDDNTDDSESIFNIRNDDNYPNKNGKSIIEPVISSDLDPDSAFYKDGASVLQFRPDLYNAEIDADDLGLWRREMSGFKRWERLDVKKPGPQFSTNNFAFKTNEDSNEEKTNNDKTVPPKDKKVLTIESKEKSTNKYDNIDLDHVYIQFNEEFKSWPEGNSVVQTVEKLIGLNPGALSEIRVARAEVTFAVKSNNKNFNSTDVANKINHIRNHLSKVIHREVIGAGIGDKIKLPIVERAKEPDSTVFGVLVASGVIAVTLAAVTVIFIVRKHAKIREKLAGLRNPDPESSRDYQDLCRAKMQAKQEKPLGSPKAFNFARLIEAKTGETCRPTSSWSEDPQVSNMDIATCKKILSSLEEYVKNQNKIDEEWKILCAYEPEPCSTAIAEAEGNSEFNRSGAALPYDHSRVILNDLTNVKNLDYINASTITDHDPRNPTYIATQGPLPQTCTDFWQLVWEQGSVVIVMLTSLNEDGQVMCHRYWPEEGSTRYDMYEVHLVSEHIWCDDYLVRSFYLKNLRTSETRTVTQFHFLTWPSNEVPESAKTLLEFRRKVNKSYRGRSCPIIVHCSDGAGRTGTYCLIDMILNRLTKGVKEVDIIASLEHIRDQRPHMVANQKQYEFVRNCIIEEVQAIMKTLPANTTNTNNEKQLIAVASTSSSSVTKSDK